MRIVLIASFFDKNTPSMHFFLKKVCKIFGGSQKTPYLCTRKSEIDRCV